MKPATEVKFNRPLALGLAAALELGSQLTIVLSIADAARHVEDVSLAAQLATLRKAAYRASLQVFALVEELGRTGVPPAKPTRYAEQEYRNLTAFIGHDLSLAEPLVRQTAEWFQTRMLARERERGVILQEILSRVAGCPRTPANCQAEAPGDITRWCMQCLLRFGMKVEYPGLERG